MSSRGSGRFAAAAIAVGGLSSAGPARADEVASRYGLAPLVGGGAAVVTNSGVFPGFIGFTTLGGEVLGEVPPWGGFFRGEFLSSGNDARWTALSFALGVSRRFFGEPETLSLLARGGVAYQHWHASTGGCDVLFLVPNSCISQDVPPAPGTIMTAPRSVDFNGDAFGVLAGVRLELPIAPVFVALDASFVPVIDVSAVNPGAVLSFKLDLVVGFRDNRTVGEITPSQVVPRARSGPSY